MLVTAEPYFAVNQPGNVVVLENVIPANTASKVENIDARFELLSRAQIQRIAEFQARAGNWLPTARGYRVFVLDPRTDHALEQALRRALPARVVFSSPQVVVLRRRG